MFADENRYKDEYKDYEKAKIAPVATPEEQLARLIAGFNLMAKTIQDTLIPAIESITSHLVPIVKKVGETILNLYPNKRVVYLALHGKPRVRKKNIKRIIKWSER